MAFLVLSVSCRSPNANKRKAFLYFSLKFFFFFNISKLLPSCFFCPCDFCLVWSSGKEECRGHGEGGVSALGGRWMAEGVIARRTAEGCWGGGGDWWWQCWWGYDQAERKIQIDWVLICWRTAAAAAVATPPPLLPNPYLNPFQPPHPSPSPYCPSRGEELRSRGGPCGPVTAS